MGIKPHLLGALPHGVDQLCDDQVHTLLAGLLDLGDLPLHDGLKGHIRGEKAGPEGGRRRLGVRWCEVV